MEEQIIEDQIERDVERLGPLSLGKGQIRMSTNAELCLWMNGLSSQYGTGVVHTLLPDNRIQYRCFAEGVLRQSGVL